MVVHQLLGVLVVRYISIKKRLVVPVDDDVKEVWALWMS